jgi:hypothetical protein
MRHKAIILVVLLVAFFAAASYAAGVFSHKVHRDALPEYAECTPCHAEGALSLDVDRSKCAECHESAMADSVEIPPRETHGAFWFREHGTYVAPDAPGVRENLTQCASCHEESFCLDCHKGGFREATISANVHVADVLVTHPIRARMASAECASCHEDRFCLDCHDRYNRNDLGFDSHRRSWSDLTAGASGPAHSTFTSSDCQTCHVGGVLPSHDWTLQHGREARRYLDTCKACHPDADVCIKCHSATTGLGVNPHPKGWDSIYSNYEQAGRATCKKCH